MIVLKDSNGNTITEIKEGHAIKFHNRIIINPDLFINEGDNIMLLTNENLDNIIKYFNDEMIRTIKESIATMKEFIKYKDRTNKMMKQLENDNKELKQLNNELNVKIIDLNTN